MGSHVYISKRIPPKWWDVVLAHAVEIGVAGYCAVMGTVVVFSAKGYSPEDSTLGHLPLFLIYGVGLFVGLGGYIALYGLLIRRNNIRVELNIEQIGWIILAVGWASYVWAAVRYADEVTSAVVAGLFIGLGGALRAVALILLERDLDRAKSTLEEADEQMTSEDAQDEEDPDANR